MANATTKIPSTSAYSVAALAAILRRMTPRVAATAIKGGWYTDGTFLFEMTLKDLEYFHRQHEQRPFPCDRGTRIASIGSFLKVAAAGYQVERVEPVDPAEYLYQDQACVEAVAAEGKRALFRARQWNTLAKRFPKAVRRLDSQAPAQMACQWVLDGRVVACIMPVIRP